MERRVSKANRDDLNYKGATMQYDKCMKCHGLAITYNGKNNLAINTRIAKAERAINMCKQACSAVGNVSVKLAMTLFDKQIAPILTYCLSGDLSGDSIWGLLKANRCLLVENIPNTVGDISKYSRDLVNTVCRKTIQLKSVRRARSADNSAIAACLTFEHVADKELFKHSFSTHLHGLAMENGHSIF